MTTDPTLTAEPLFKVEVVTSTPPVVTTEKAQGYGALAVATHIACDRMVRINVIRNGETQFGIGVNEDGTITFTDYADVGYIARVPSSLRLRPSRPWTAEPSA